MKDIHSIALGPRQASGQRRKALAIVRHQTVHPAQDFLSKLRCFLHYRSDRDDNAPAFAAPAGRLVPQARAHADQDEGQHRHRQQDHPSVTRQSANGQSLRPDHTSHQHQAPRAHAAQPSNAASAIFLTTAMPFSRIQSTR